jgi:small subunit ribosomal protein S13
VSKEFNYIVRIHGTNLDGTKTIPYALCDIKGVGIRIARSVISKLDINPTLRLGSLSEGEVRRIDKAIDDPKSVGIPKWMLNRKKDPWTGEDMHLLSSDLELRVKEDIDLMKETRSWKGDRHSRGLKVRGQHTKTTARKGQSVGVSRSRVRQQR